MPILELFEKAAASLKDVPACRSDYTRIEDALNAELTATVEFMPSGNTLCHEFEIELDDKNSILFKLAHWELTPKSYVFNVLGWQLNVDGSRYNGYYNKTRSVAELGNRELEVDILAGMDNLIDRLKAIV